MSARSTIRYTYRDYLTIPEDPAHRHEIVDGELHVSAAPRFRHQEVVTSLSRIVGNLAVPDRLGKVLVGPIGVHLHDELVLEPDLVFIRRDRLSIVDPEGDVHGPPDLVVEVLSPSNREYDRGLKRKRYLRNGVREVWIVDAEAEAVEVWRSGAGVPESPDEVLEWTVEGRTFEIFLADVFETF